MTVLPKAHLVCLESMLFYYGYSDLTSHVWSVMVPCNILLNKLEIDAVELDIRFALKDLYDIGKTIEDFNVIQLIIYDQALEVFKDYYQYEEIKGADRKK